MPDRHLQRDRTAIAETKEISLFDVQIVQQRRSVVRRLLEAERPVGKCRGPFFLLHLLGWMTGWSEAEAPL
jgi:hypothetical protein